MGISDPPARRLSSPIRAPVKPEAPTSAATQPERSYELEISLFLVLSLTGVYIAYDLLAEPSGGHPFGHWLGIVGTTLMLLTEILYSLRKRTTFLARAGPVRHWLAFHIVTGIVGPFLVLMHTGLVFRGLAGLTFWLTVIVVLSGFVGRYLYTALARSRHGLVLSRNELAKQAESVKRELQRFQSKKPLAIRKLIAQQAPARPHHPLLLILFRGQLDWLHRRRLERAIRQLDQIADEQARQLDYLLQRKHELERQAETLATARRLLRLWHLFHVPLGLALFFSVFLHVAATVYFRAGILR